MSSSEGEEEVKEPLPEHRVRFSDMPEKLVESAVRSKSLILFCLVLTFSRLLFPCGLQFATQLLRRKSLTRTLRQRFRDLLPRIFIWTVSSSACIFVKLSSRRMRGLARDSRQELRLEYYLPNKVGDLFRPSRVPQVLPTIQNAIKEA